MGRRPLSIAEQGIRFSWPVIACIALVGLASVLGNLGSLALQRAVVTMLINLVVVIGLYIFIGNSGVLSFGHIGFMAIGAYAAGILVTPLTLKQVVNPDLPSFLVGVTLHPVVGTLAAGAVAAVVAMVLAVPISRLSGLAAGLATFAFLVIVNVVATNWSQLTNAARGMSGIPMTVTAKSAFITVCGVMVIAFLFQRSDFGLRLRASRDDEVAARAAGINVARHRGVALVISAFCVGIGGALSAQFVGSIFPNVFYLSITFITLAMLVVGGMRSLAGAVVGTVFISAVDEFLRSVEVSGHIGPIPLPSRPGVGNVVLAVIMLVVLLVRPRGITNGREFSWPPRLALSTVRRHSSRAGDKAL